MLFVGDFYQHTFDTSRDGATNSTLFNSKAKYESRFTAKGFICDNTSLVNSWRCSKNVCQFYTTSEVYTIFGIASVNIWNPWFYSGEVWARAIGQWFHAVPVFGRAWWNCYEIVIFQWQRIILPQAPVLKIGWPCHNVRRSKHRAVSALRRKRHYVSSFFLLNCDPLRWARSLVFVFPCSPLRIKPACGWALIRVLYGAARRLSADGCPVAGWIGGAGYADHMKTADSWICYRSMLELQDLASLSVLTLSRSGA